MASARAHGPGLTCSQVLANPCGAARIEAQKNGPHEAGRVPVMGKRTLAGPSPLARLARLTRLTFGVSLPERHLPSGERSNHAQRTANIRARHSHADRA